MIKCQYQTLETNFGNLVSVLTEILMANLYSLEGHFTFVITFLYSKMWQNNFVDNETKLQKLCKALIKTDFVSKYPIKKLPF